MNKPTKNGTLVFIGAFVALETIGVAFALMWAVMAAMVAPSVDEPFGGMFGAILSSVALFVFLFILSLRMVYKNQLDKASRIIMNGPRQVGVGILATLVTGIGLKYTVGYDPIAYINMFIYGFTVVAYGWDGLMVAMRKG